MQAEQLTEGPKITVQNRSRCLCGCGRELHSHGRGPGRRFYSDACRAEYWRRQHPRLPFSGRASMARHCSQQAAAAASSTRGTKTALYLAWLSEHGPAIDHAAAQHFGWPLSTVNSIRNGCLAHGARIVPAGKAPSPYGQQATRWAVKG